MAPDLEQLGPTGFQDLAGALAVASFGPGVQAMGSGRDGGRDLYHIGPLHWPPTEDQTGEHWDGYTVFQVKHKERLDVLPEDNARWLQGQIRGELQKWADPARRRNPLPDGLVFITNVPLSPTPDVGGHDQTLNGIKNYIATLGDASRDVDGGAERKVKHERLSHIRRWRIWDANEIQTLLNVHKGVRHAFPAFLTAADVFAYMLRQKVSGCLRTLTGARQFCATRSYLSTAAKHGKHFFEVLVMLTEGRPWLPATP